MNPLSPISRFVARDRGTPTAQDFSAAGFALEGGSVVRGLEFIGLAAEFGIVGRAYDKVAKKLITGRFLIQYTDMEGEVLHHAYEVHS